MKFSRIALLLTGASFIACQTEGNEPLSETTQSNVTPQVIAKLANYDVNTKDVRKVDFLLPDGTTTEMIQMEGDIHMPESQVLGLPNLQNVSGKNYHTNNLVSQNTVIEIIGFTGGN